VDAEQSVRQKWRLLKATMDERSRRLWAGAEADVIGYGGVAAVARATGMAISTVRKGRDEARAGATPADVVKIRRSGGTRSYEAAHPEVWEMLETLVDPLTRGDPESPLRWTCKSTSTLSSELFSQHGIRISDKTVGKLLREHGYSLQAPNKSVEGAQHPDRNAQFERINKKSQDCIKRGIPVISVDTKKKELIGNFKNGGREWQPKGEPEKVDVHDFPGDALGKAIPYGVYDIAANDGFVSVGVDHDTPVFAATSIEAWWKQVGESATPRPERSSLLPMQVAATATGRTSGDSSFSSSPTSSILRSMSATSRPAPASGTRSNTDFSRSFRSIGVADRFARTRRLSASLAIRPIAAVSSSEPGSIAAATRSERRSPPKIFVL
jgi:transposase